MPSLFPTQPHSPTGEKSPLYVITAISNPWRYRTRYELYEKFAKMVDDAGAILYTVEIAFGNRPFAITDSCNPKHIQLRTDCEIWHKENMINLGVERLPKDWEYMAWVDADISFARPDWCVETLNLLQHYHVIQMFSIALDLGPNFEPFQKHNGFMYSYEQNLRSSKEYTNWHPGFAWAIRRQAFNDLGGLIDIAILGSADRHMCASLIGKAETTLNRNLTQNYKDAVLIWQDRALQYIKKNVGYMPGTVTHQFHGNKKDRRYASRWALLVDNHFDPVLDLKEDWQGLFQLTDRNLKLRDQIRSYFAGRRDDDSFSADEMKPLWHNK